jgi:hypothetical protein
VEDWEWDAEQARRLVDVARHAWRWGGRLRAMRLLARAVATSPSGALGETWRRTKDKLSRHKAGPQMKPA